MIVKIDNKVEPTHSYASERTRGLYNVGVEDGCRFRMEVDVPIERDDWQIGVIVGPSGSGKTSIARAIGDQGWIDGAGWWKDEGLPVIDYLCQDDLGGEYAKATAALSAVGLGSVPSWLRPFRVLSNGERFRAEMARIILDRSLVDIYIDEFTSVLDRQVAQVGAGAFAKAWRRQPERRVVLITPHYDILEWIEPDWWIDTAEGADEFADDREVIVAREGDFQSPHDRSRYRGDWVGSLEC